MPRGYNNYSFVIDSSFQPFTMQEMLTPFLMYKEAFEKSEEAYNDLTNKADKFKYLADNLDPNSKAAQIYNGYADTLRAQATDLAQNGLTMGNRRALTGLKQRYQGEIGRLVDADTALKQEQALRRQMSAKDPSMLYGTDNLNIDMFLDNNTPNLYGISGNELYAKGAAAGKAASARIYSSGDAGSTLGGYYRDYVQRMGYTPQQLAQFGKEIREDFAKRVSVLPELQEQADAILSANGVNNNLSGRALEQARAQVINGMIDGAVYNESHNPQRDLGVPTWSERRAAANDDFNHRLALEQFELSKAERGITGNAKDGYTIDPSKSLKVQEAAAIAKAKSEGKGNGSTGGSKGSGSEYRTVGKTGVRLEWNGNTPNPTNGDADNDMKKPVILKDVEDYVGEPVDYDKLPPFVQAKVDAYVGPNGDVDDYEYYYREYKSSIWGDTETAVDIVPRTLSKHNVEESENQFDIH